MEHKKKLLQRPFCGLGKSRESAQHAFPRKKWSKSFVCAAAAAAVAVNQLQLLSFLLEAERETAPL